jgi:transposase
MVSANSSSSESKEKVAQKSRPAKESTSCDGGNLRRWVRPLALDPATYAQRTVVERCINRINQWRGLVTRYEQRAVNYRAVVVTASLVLWLDDRL